MSYLSNFFGDSLNDHAAYKWARGDLSDQQRSNISSITQGWRDQALKQLAKFGYTGSRAARILAAADLGYGGHRNPLEIVDYVIEKGFHVDYFNYLIGNTRNNRLTGDSRNNLLDGVGGADVMSGKGGNDTYIVNHAKDRVIEKAKGGTDTIRSSVTETLSAHVENLVLTGKKHLKGYGNSSNNRLTGNSGSNVLEGKAGRDILTGKGGGDKFVYRSTNDSGITKSTRDIITDFDGTESDVIDLSKIDAYAASSGNQTFVYIGSDSFSGTQGEVRFASGILSVNTGTDTTADMQIKLNGVTEFSSDFLIL